MRRRPALLPTLVFLAAAPAAFAQTPAASSDADWKPEKLTNVTVLPKDTSPERMMAIMREWNAALGMQCIGCHVGLRNAPLSTFDFAADTKPIKEVSRTMQRVTDDLNVKLKDVGDKTDGPKVTCATCHRRNRHPETEPPPEPPKPPL